MKRVEVVTLWEKEKPNGYVIRVKKATFVHNSVTTYEYQVVVYKTSKRSKILWSSSWKPARLLMENLQIAIQKANGD